MGESLKFRVNISEETTTWDNATSGTLLYAIKNSTKTVGEQSVSMVVSTPTSIPGRAATAETEAEIASTQDDYGTSYYYRGNVTNNYVNYSGMCWRIVRVQGDGTIKLALADENGTCDASSYSTTNTDSAFITSSTQKFAYKSSTSGTVSDYNYNNSDVATILKAWSGLSSSRSYTYYSSSNNSTSQTGTFTNDVLDTSKLVDAEWCVDTAKTSISGNDSFYGAYNRLYPVSTANPTLKCNTKGMEGTEGIEASSQRYVSKIALLTADEIAFAGSIYLVSTTSPNHYLRTNTNTSGFSLTLSPNQSHLTSFGIIAMVSNGNITLHNTNTSSGLIRPSIVLNSNVTIASSGNGTQSSPYVIN